MDREQKRQAAASLLNSVPVKEIMTSPVISIHVDENFSKVVRLFNDHHIRHLPVVNSQNKVVGIMTQRDLYKVQSPRKLEDGSWYYDTESLDDIVLARVMNTQVTALTPDNTVADALKPMAKLKYGCLPVVKDQKLVGIITQFDIIKTAARIAGVF